MGNYAGIVINGLDNRNERLGADVEILGDINNDGIADFAVSAIDAGVEYAGQYYGTYYRSEAGSVYVVFGEDEAEGGFPTEIDVSELDGTNGFEITPDSNLFDRFRELQTPLDFGESIVGLGDINGDNIDDFGVTLPSTYSSYYGSFYDGPDAYAGNGVAYVILGGQDFAATQEVDELDGFRIDADGEVTEIVALGDINGDGINDVGINSVDRDSYGTRSLDFYFLYDVNGNGVYDTDGYDNGNYILYDRYYTGSIDAFEGQKSSFVVFGTDQPRESGSPIPNSNEPHETEIVVNVNDLDGSDGFSVLAGRSLTGGYGGFFEVASPSFGSTSGEGGILGLGDVNGDGIDDFMAYPIDGGAEVFQVGTVFGPNVVGENRVLNIIVDRGYYSYDTTLNVTTYYANGGSSTEVFDDVDPSQTYDSSSGGYVIFGNAPGVPFPEEIDPNGFPQPDEVEFRSGAIFDSGDIASVGNAVGNDVFDDVAIRGFLSSNESENTLGVSVSGVLLIPGSENGGPDALTNSTFLDENALLADDAAAFYYDGSSTIGTTGTSTITFFGAPALNIAGAGDMNNDGADDFAFSAQRREFDLDNQVNSTVQEVVYLTFGSLGTPNGLVDLADSFGEGIAAADRMAYRIEGFDDFFGLTLAGGGDVNKDGFDDLIIGDDTPITSGVDNAYVVFGGLDALSAVDAADGSEDGVIDVANLAVDVATGILPIELSLQGNGGLTRFLTEGDSGTTLFQFTVERNGDLTQEASFDFAVTPSGNDGAEADDFFGGSFPSGTVDFEVGETTATIDIEVQGDFDIEQSEDFTVTISNAMTVGDAPISITQDTAVGRIFNDDNPVRLRVNNAVVDEGDSDTEGQTLRFVVSRSGENDVDVTVDYEIILQSADAGDFEPGTPLTGSVVIPAGENTRTIELPINEDDTIEPNETVRINLTGGTATAPDGAPVGTIVPVEFSDSVGFGTIVSDDLPVQLRVFNASVTEGNPGDTNDLVFQVVRSGSFDEAFDVDVTFTQGLFNPADGNDFLGSPFGTQTVSFIADQATAEVRLPVRADVDIEFNERIDATLSNPRSPTGEDIIFDIIDNFGYGIISNDDFPPRISVFSGGSNNEGTFGSTTPFSFFITRTGDTEGATDVTFDIFPGRGQGSILSIDSGDISGIVIDGEAIPGSGFVPGFGYVASFEDGQSEIEVVVNVNHDGVPEANEVMGLQITDVQSFNGTTYEIFRSFANSTVFNDDGLPPIIPPGVEADVFGDPHIVTLDGLGYDFQAVGEYILVETLPGATNPFQVQVRFEPLPGSDLVSTTTRMAVNIGDSIFEVDALGADPFLITDSAGTTRPVSADEIALGVADLNGDDVPDVYFDVATGEFTVVLNDQNEQLKGKVMDGTMNVCVFLADTATGNQGNVRGLMGDADGDSTTNDDLAIRAGTVVPVGAGLVDINGDPVPEGTALAADTPLPQPLDFNTLYGIFADGWRLDGSSDDKMRTFSDDLPDLPAEFPAALLTVDDLPADVRAQAVAAVEAAEAVKKADFERDNPGQDYEELDPSVFDAAVLDFALTGNPDFISGALGLAAEEEASTEPENSPELPVTVSVSVQPDAFDEGDTGTVPVTFTFFRLDDGSIPVSLDYEITGSADADDVAEGTAFSGTVDFAEGETEQTVVVEVLGDLLTEVDETLTVTITDSGGALIAGASATAVISTDDFAPVAQDDEFSTDALTRVEGDLFADNQAEDDTDNTDSDADGDDLTVTSVDGAPINLLAPITLDSGARLRVFEDGTFIYDPFGVLDASAPFDGFAFLEAGEVAVDTFTYTISDGNGGFDTATASVTIQGVNDAPVAAFDSLIVSEDELVGGIVDLLANDQDPEGSDLKVTSVSLGTIVVSIPEGPDGAGFDFENGSAFLATQDGNFLFGPFGAYEALHGRGGSSVTLTFGYTIEDEQGVEGTGTVQVRVDGKNDTPEAASDNATTPFETAVTIDVLANDSDIDEGDVLSILALTDGAGGTTAVVDGKVVYTPNEGFSGEDTFTYQAFDGVAASETVSVTITVGAQENNAPVAQDDAYTTNEDTDVLVDPLANDTDDDDDVLSFEVISGPSDGQLVETEGGLAYRPNDDFNGEDSFVYEVSDGNGGTDQATATITVDAVNDAPIAGNDAGSADEGSSVEIDVLANDFDVDGDTIGIVASIVTGAAFGSVVSNSDGNLVYTPDDPNFNGSDTFTYRISDGSLFADGTVDITINPINDAPEAEDDAATTDEDKAVTIDILANDSDVDGDDLEVSLGDPSNGTVALVDGVYVYTPNADFNGTDSFMYTVSDGELQDTATVTITVDPVNDAPVAANDTATTNEDSSVIIDILANDSDVDGDDLDVVLGSPSNGSVELVEGSYVYTPNGNFNGTDSFTYTISDGELEDTATVDITVNAVNDGPEIDDAGPFEVAENTTFVGTITASDIDSDTLEFSLGASDDADLFDIDPTSGALSFKSAPDFETPGSDAGTNTYQVSVNVTDGEAFDDTSFEVIVTDVEEGTVFNTVTGTEGRDNLVGTDGADIIRSLGGSYDRITGGAGPDQFVFGDETSNGRRERDLINDFEVGVDALVLEDGAEIKAMREYTNRVLVQFEGDGDVLYVLGDGLTIDNMTIIDGFDFTA